MSIYEYMQNIYNALGAGAVEWEAQRILDMFNNDKEAFDVFITEEGIDLNVRTVDDVETDWQIWRWNWED